MLMQFSASEQGAHAHPVLGQGSGLVDTQYGRCAQRFDGCKPARQDVGPGQAPCA